jgi:hypothetical protein
MRQDRRPRRNQAEDQEQRRRELIERSISGHGPEAVASRKRLDQPAVKNTPSFDRPKIVEPGRTPGSAEGERPATETAEKVEQVGSPPPAAV